MNLDLLRVFLNEHDVPNQVRGGQLEVYDGRSWVRVELPTEGVA